MLIFERAGIVLVGRATRAPRGWCLAVRRESAHMSVLNYHSVSIKSGAPRSWVTLDALVGFAASHGVANIDIEVDRAASQDADQLDLLRTV